MCEINADMWCIHTIGRKQCQRCQNSICWIIRWNNGCFSTEPFNTIFLLYSGCHFGFGTCYGSDVHGMHNDILNDCQQIDFIEILHRYS